MTDSEPDVHKIAGELRLTRVKALNNKYIAAVMTDLLARLPDTFPAMLNDALSSVSPKQSG